ncbi:hypothetical protein Fot_03213 [Forsythia ovata]|uniref:Uncharacterized protein n=1 Tax=Forsythia ovata TaxID=205694 RepID=A0ABD1X935_9LAMI
MWVSPPNKVAFKGTVFSIMLGFTESNGGSKTGPSMEVTEGLRKWAILRDETQFSGEIISTSLTSTVRLSLKVLQLLKIKELLEKKKQAQAFLTQLSCMGVV